MSLSMLLGEHKVLEALPLPSSFHVGNLLWAPRDSSLIFSMSLGAELLPDGWPTTH